MGLVPISMSNSASATLFFGYCWNDDEAADRIKAAILRYAANRGPDDDDDDDETGDERDVEWVDAVAARRGLVNPWTELKVPPGLGYQQKRAFEQDWIAAHEADLDAWRAAKKAIEAEFGIEIGFHGHTADDYSAPHLVMNGGEKDVSSIDGMEVTPEMLTIDPAWMEALDRWLAEFGIKPPHDKPRWWIVANYG